MRRLAAWTVVLACAAVPASACKRREEAAALPPDAAVAPRPRPAELGHVTLKVLGMT